MAWVVVGRRTATIAAAQNRNQVTRWTSGSPPLRKRRITRDSANTAKATSTIWMMVMPASPDEPADDQLGRRLHTNQEVLALRQRVLGVDGGDGDLGQLPALLPQLLDELRRDLHAVGAQVDGLGRAPGKAAQPALAVSDPHAE